MSGTIGELLELRDLDRDALAERLGIDPARAERDVRYEGLSPVVALHDADAHPATFFFHPDGRPAVAYLPRAAARELDAEALAAELGEPAARLRSRAGKRDMLWVYPDRGLAFSRSKDGVSFVEAFAPTTLDRYRDAIYREPAAFIR